MKKLILILSILISTNTLAQNSDALCELTKAKAELSASILSSPYVYGTNNESNTGTLALGYSFSGLTKGNLEKEIANTKCDMLAVTSLLEEYQQGILTAILKVGARAELVELLKAKTLAQEYSDILSKQVEAKTATILDYNNSRQILAEINNKLDNIKRILAEPTLAVNMQDIPELLTKSKILEGKVAELTAKREAENSWDVTIAAGAQKDLAQINSSVGPFVGLSFRWSFGNYGVKDSINNIRSKAEDAFSTNMFGYAKNIERLVQKLNSLSLVEEDRREILNKNIKEIEVMLSNIGGINTSTAISNKYLLEIQLLVMKAELAGINARLNKYLSIKN